MSTTTHEQLKAMRIDLTGETVEQVTQINPTVKRIRRVRKLVQETARIAKEK